jgi:hypothetical protein
MALPMSTPAARQHWTTRARRMLLLWCRHRGHDS